MKSKSLLANDEVVFSLKGDALDYLLVVCKSADCVADVLACAKLLRNSADPEIKRMVFINPNLTKAEARAAYELRCERRLLAQRRASQRHVDNRDVDVVSNQDASR